MLVVDDGRRTHRLAALPGPDDAAPLAGPDPPRWRAAFSAPAGYFEAPHLAYALDAGGGIFVDLPIPREAPRERPAPPRPRPAPAEPAPDLHARAEAERRARERREAMRALEGLVATERTARIEAERRAQHEAQARERLEAELVRQGHRAAELEAEV